MPDDSIRHGKHIQLMWDISEVSATGATGDPTKASIEKGQKMLDALRDVVVESILELEKTDWNYDRRLS